MRNFAILKGQFEDRTAICQEGTFWLVHVRDITLNLSRRFVSFEAVWLPGMAPSKDAIMSLDAGFLTQFSDRAWTMGYGGWTLFFDDRMIRDMLAFAAALPHRPGEQDYIFSLNEFIWHNHPSVLRGQWRYLFPQEPPAG